MLRSAARSRSSATSSRRSTHWRTVLSKPLAAVGVFAMTIALLSVATPAVAALLPTQATTATVVTSSANPSIPGQEVRFTAQVKARLGGSPTGTIQFNVDGLALGTPVAVVQGVAISEGVADLNSAIGHDVVAVYAGDSDFASSSGAMTQRVGADLAVATVTSSLNPSVFGEGVSFTATVTAAALVPPGSVQFSIDGEPFDDPVPVVDGIAESTETTTLSLGEHRVGADFMPDTPSPSSSGTLIQAVGAAESSVELTSSSNPAAFGDPVTFTAEMSSFTTGTPAGTVQFLVDGAPLGNPVALEDGRAHSPVVNDLSVADHVISVVYEGKDPFGPSNDELTQTVVQATTTTTLTSSASPSSSEDAVVFTASVAATVPSEAEPTGAVQFNVDGLDVGAPVTIIDGSATSEPVSGLTPGDHDVVADYLGDTNFLGSTDAIMQIVAVVDTETSLTSSANPSKLGDAVTFSATVTELPSSTPSPFVMLASGGASGTVLFALDGVPYGTPIATVDGVASISIADLSAGAHTITATFAGSGFASSVGSVTQQVDEIAPPSPPAPTNGEGGDTLPATGSDFAPTLGVGLSLLLLALGALQFVVVIRRRRQESGR